MGKKGKGVPVRFFESSEELEVLATKSSLGKRPNTESFRPILYNFMCTWKSIYVLSCRGRTFTV